MDPSRRIVLTGGPGAGKSVIGREIAGRYPDRFVLIPEAATQVYTRLGTRWDRLSIEERRDVQRQIYRWQLEQEQRIAEAHPGHVLLLDRGTIDGAAYWPDGPDQYWVDVGSTHGIELSRYDAVIWLETAAALGIYDGDASNAVRFEHADAAVDAGRKLLELWGPHPNLRHVGAFVHFEDKVSAVCEMLP
ncbi:ATP/GTP-binding protein [Humisphaera borealis]|uniref:ATP-binding protein n=1 Tax=Humisphaera borealis TaxID=2807512 RepID=A0A7M2WQJ1_9BACT|nr:ATP-binding protein [Humisphaera borealis]QOV87797.1 ATP-binding protein [Humisphaera borealis]